MDRVTEATESVFNAVAQIQRLDEAGAGLPELVHQQLSMYVEQAARAAGRIGFAQQDLDDMRYALVALADEIVLQKGGALRDFWLPRLLQLRYFNENVAGTAFFERLDAIRRDPTRAEVLRVYYLCLLFGFQGKYRVRGGQIELADIVDRVKSDLIRARVITSEQPLSPQGARPYEPIADARRNSLLVWLSVAAASASFVLYLWLKLSLGSDASRLVERVVALTGA
jgi:type VI secretion system protein ImpK